MDLPTSRKEALKLDQTKFFDGKKCPKGHMSIRHVQKGCMKCDKIRVQKYRQTPKGQILYKTAIRNWRQSHRAYLNEYGKNWLKNTDIGRLYKRYNRLKVRMYLAKRTLGFPFSYFRDMYYAQKGRCALTGRRMIVGGGEQGPDTLSFDRLDWRKGYIIGNIRLVTLQANSARYMGTDQELIKLCRDLIRTSKRNGRPRAPVR